MLFSLIHFYRNKHLPKYEKYLSYQPSFIILEAKFIVSEKDFHDWVEKYKLIEEQGSLKQKQFCSKIRANGQKIVGSYNPKNKILSMKYCAF
ncbi:hypothetical protein AAEX28_06390 [Lentisphaerota bacterium WC36G]|nr:hypothetical protein LJT99_09255 [Lentisphaerae bacterium WC36]